MLENELLEYIFNALAQSNQVVFNQDQIKDWPENFLNLLLNHGIMKPAQPARVIECKGCEENCIMPVHVFPSEGKKPARAFIACDKREDIGRVDVNLNQLNQWHITHEILINFLMKIFELKATPTLIDDKKWHIGTFKGIKHKTPIVLLAENTLSLSLAGHTTPLLEVLKFEENRIILDRNKIIFLTDNPLGNSETPADRRNRLIHRINQEREKRTKDFLKVIAKEEKISVSRLKQITTRPPSSKKLKPQDL